MTRRNRPCSAGVPPAVFVQRRLLGLVRDGYVTLLILIASVLTGCRSAPTQEAQAAAPGQSADPDAEQVDKWFRTLPDRFNADAAKNVTVIYQFRMTTKDGMVYIYTVVVDRRTCKVEDGEAAKADAVISSKCADWILISSRKVSGFWAFMTGRLKVDGDKTRAKDLERLFFQEKAGEKKELQTT